MRYRPDADGEIPRVAAERAARYREAGWWLAGTLDELILRHRHSRATHCALVDGERRLNHGELAAAVDRTANALRSAGIGHGDTVVVQLPNSLEYVVLVLALMRIGAPPVLTLPALREYELERILQLTRPSAIAIPRRMRRFDHLAMVETLRARHPYLGLLLIGGADGHSPPDALDLTELCRPDGEAVGHVMDGPAVRSQDAALFLLSSGTTGPPKVIPRTHEDYGHVIRTTTTIAGVDADTVYLAVMPTTHTFVLAYPGILGTLAAGGTVVLGSTEDPRRALQLIEREQVTHCAATPGLAAQWLNTLRTDPYAVSSLAVLQVGGAKLDRAGAERVRAELGCAVQQVYGMSEGLTNYTRLDDPDEVLLSTQGRPACPGDEILIVDEEERPVPPGEAGQLLTRGPFTVAGYYRDARATERAFTAEGFYRTGDLVRLRPDGNLVLVGRIKNVINRGGEKICAEELEELVRELPSVAEVAAVPRPHPGYGETVSLYVVAAGGSLPQLRKIRAHLQARGLARYKLPERLEILNAMPLVGVGKLDRAALRERGALDARADFGAMPADGDG